MTDWPRRCRAFAAAVAARRLTIVHEYSPGEGGWGSNHATSGTASGGAHVRDAVVAHLGPRLGVALPMHFFHRGTTASSL